MALDLTGYQQEIQRIVDKDKRLQTELEQKEKLLEELRKEISDLKETSEKFKPFMDIIEREEKENYLINIRDTWLFKQLKIKARLVYGPTGDTGSLFRQFVEGVLKYSVTSGWIVLKSHVFPKGPEQ